MTGGTTPRGYTIVEVLIFMAISGLMFILAANFINGKQGAAEFRQGMTNIETRVTGVLNDVTNGVYPSSVDFTCSVAVPTDPTSTPKITKSTTNKQGTNRGCIFFGKVIHFGIGTNNDQYRVYSVTARQADKTGAPVKSFSTALPIAINATATGSSAYFDPTAMGVNLTERDTLQYGLEIKKALLCTGNCSAGTPIGMFGFFGSLGNAGISTNADPQSGAQTVVAAVIPSSTLGLDEPTGAKLINDRTRLINNTHLLGNGKYILLCFLNGNRAGSLTIGGGNSRQLTTQLETGAGVPSVC